MTFWAMLRTLIIEPLKLVFEVIFQLVYAPVRNPGVCIIALSLVMNILVLPLYRRADAMQEEARDRENALAPGVKHIKKTFSGNERMMMLQTYYKQSHYSPLSAFRGSVSLLLEIPFFMAAYQFLSNLPLLEGTSFGPIKNLGAPDQLLHIGSLFVNVLPILMTLINFASAAIYLRGFPLKTKLRTYAIAVAFLVLLYKSPAGLVFYWTLNNVFSLFKNLIHYLIVPGVKKHREKRAAERGEIQRSPAAELKAAKRAEKAAKKKEKRENRKAPVPDRRLFILTEVFLTILVGAFIPSVYLAASPLEYVNISYYYNPIWYNISAFILAAGFFLLWFGVFYWLASPKGKVIFERVMAALSVVGVVNYMFFGTKLGVVSSALKFEGGVGFETMERIVNGIVIVGIIAIMLTLVWKFPKIIKFVFAVGIAALLVMSVINTGKTRTTLKGLQQGAKNDAEEERTAELHLTRTGKNVVVLFLDRAIGEYVPVYLKENPDFAKIFDGFTWYSNTISYGGHTNLAAPALLGGYEYTPVEINRRDTEKLKVKHNEALLTIPLIFQENGYEITVCDPPYANYSWISDLSLYDDYPGINAFITKGTFGTEYEQGEVTKNNLRNFFVFSLMKTLSLELQPGLYDGGNYLIAGGASGNSSQFGTGISKSRGFDQDFMDSYKVLENLVNITEIQDEGKNQYLFFYNDATHEPMIVKEPEYVPDEIVDNTEYDEGHMDRFTVDGKELRFDTRQQISHYESDMACLLQVGKWFDYLRENGVYDNTRIIIVSDHGYYVGHDENRVFKRKNRTVDTTGYYPLFMVKDFNETGFHISDEFMTNADTAYLSVQGLIDNPKNPFTGKEISMDEKTAHDQFIITTKKYQTRANDKTFPESGWAVISSDINNREDWEFIDEDIILKEHEIPEE